ncbi:MAG: hypothetical protein AUJ52_12080 [Elusimicrobia bacterium CG1_02_63_36]|nr:MAG: hypothetical protein AUJ52_12080 [Elusimicrobia bacterium CG1_02_63_36]PIP84887.1 MAG: hypothetical protein COR54_01635 [Elusimicrobia bacterium CG22_combo_CG10-13_8_21_14_all_63_91]PJA13399.1 MAG: hypothetical protein COX66_15075 [Elusimicrobia bacterium CG_4_10_14_0_2_um_filter_63_34]PJB25634.1 MAG: hypothetical protein CO113_07770 [Elusimicrobia bacterium CG_4_9_14_3_um_filter_62_55]
MGFPLAQVSLIAAFLAAFALPVKADPPLAEKKDDKTVCEVPEGGLHPVTLGAIGSLGPAPARSKENPDRVGSEEQDFEGAEYDPSKDPLNTELRAIAATSGQGGRAEGSSENIPIPRPNPMKERANAQADGRAELKDGGDPKGDPKTRSVVPSLGKGREIDPEKRPGGAKNPLPDPQAKARGDREAARLAGEKLKPETPEEKKKREEERAKYYKKLSDDLMKSWGTPDQKEDDSDKKPKNGGMGSLAGMSGAGGMPGGGPGASGGATPPGRRGAAMGSPTPASQLRKNIAMLSSIPGTEAAFKRAGVAVRDGRILGTERDLMRAEQELNGLPLQAMMQHPGILKRIGAGNAVKGLERYESVLSVVARGAGGAHTADLGADHASLVFTATRRRGLDSGFNVHHDAVSYRRGETVPGPTVSSIYDALFGSGDDEVDPALTQAQAKLGRSSLGREAGKGVWDRLKGAFASIVGGDEAARDSANSPRLAAAVLPGAVSRAGSAFSRGAAGDRASRVRQEGGDFGKSVLVDYEPRGVAPRDIVWAVSGGVGFAILLYWAFRGRRED